MTIRFFNRAELLFFNLFTSEIKHEIYVLAVYVLFAFRRKKAIAGSFCRKNSIILCINVVQELSCLRTYYYILISVHISRHG